MKKLLLATGNKGKILELRALLENLEAEILVPEEIGLELQVEETGKTYAENAAKKAKAFAKASGLLSLADDSGLEVTALDGAPGIFSARYAPEPGATDADRRAYLLQQLKKFAKPSSARFSCSAVLASPAGELHLTKGICKGMITSQERGEHGFGYDPIFLIPDMGMTMAELKMDEKNQISHRARAIKRMIPMLLSYL
jgi:XTP/dITP diphosphohydrolase